MRPWLVGPIWVACGGGSAPSTDRVVAIGDLHGDLANARAALRLAGLIDETGHWSGGNSTFVQTGDVVDRGPDSRDVLDLLRALVPEAEAAGGRVVLLLGNHEVMNLQGDWRYVDEGDVLRFGGVESRRRAFAPDGEYGRWLATLPIVAAVGDTVFAHGGVHPDWADEGVDGINALARESLWDVGAPVHGPTGPTWYRGLVEKPEGEACTELATSLSLLHAERMVVGHTTRRDGRVESRCGGRLAVIDTGISRGYGGHLAVWTVEGGDAKAAYPTGTEDVPDPP